MLPLSSKQEDILFFNYAEFSDISPAFHPEWLRLAIRYWRISYHFYPYFHPYLVNHFYRTNLNNQLILQFGPESNKITQITKLSVKLSTILSSKIREHYIKEIIQLSKYLNVVPRSQSNPHLNISLRKICVPEVTAQVPEKITRTHMDSYRTFRKNAI